MSASALLCFSFFAARKVFRDILQYYITSLHILKLSRICSFLISTIVRRGSVRFIIIGVKYDCIHYSIHYYFVLSRYHA